jgi:hypothetical protein
MKLIMTVLLLVGFSLPAMAQSGVAARRDASGNLMRDTGPYLPKGVNQGPVNNGQIRNAPAQPSNANARNSRTIEPR